MPRCLTVPPHFDVGGVVEYHIGVSIAQLSVAAHVTPAITREIVYQCHVDDKSEKHRTEILLGENHEFSSRNTSHPQSGKG